MCPEFLILDSHFSHVKGEMESTVHGAYRSFVTRFNVWPKVKLKRVQLLNIKTDSVEVFEIFLLIHLNCVYKYCKIND